MKKIILNGDSTCDFGNELEGKDYQDKQKTAATGVPILWEFCMRQRSDRICGS